MCVHTDIYRDIHTKSRQQKWGVFGARPESPWLPVRESIATNLRVANSSYDITNYVLPRRKEEASPQMDQRMLRRFEKILSLLCFAIFKPRSSYNLNKNTIINCLIQLLQFENVQIQIYRSTRKQSRRQLPSSGQQWYVITPHVEW